MNGHLDPQKLSVNFQSHDKVTQKLKKTKFIQNPKWNQTENLAKLKIEQKWVKLKIQHIKKWVKLQIMQN